MKHLTLILAAACMLVLAGCTTTTTVTNGQTNTVQRLDPERTAAAAEALATAGTIISVSKDTNSAGYLRAVSLVFIAAAESGTYNPTNLLATVDQMTVNELQTPEVKACLVAVFGVYRAYWGDAVSQKLDSVYWLKPVLLGIALGINSGLQAAAGT